FVKDLKKEAEICYEDCDIKEVAQKIIKQNINHIVITDREKSLKGIVTSFDITKAIAEEKNDLNLIITKKVVTTSNDEPISTAARKMRQNNISALPVIDENKKVTGIITSEELM
ncbi:MAG: CBS domain-containing protein, partial [Promethearchaeota archaeon]